MENMCGAINYSPNKLYDLCINAAAKQYQSKRWWFQREDLLLLPNCALLDFYETLYYNSRLYLLRQDFGNMLIFYKLLRTRKKRHCLITCYQAVLNYEHGELVSKALFDSYTQLIVGESNLDLIDVGMRMGSFLNEGGWYDYSVQFLDRAKALLAKKHLCLDVQLKLMECDRLKLLAESLHCNFMRARETYLCFIEIMKFLERNTTLTSVFASCYCTLSTYFFVQSNFDESYRCALKAFTLLPQGLTNRTVLDILRQTSKACVMKRKFAQAGLLIKQAMNLGVQMDIKRHHPIFSDLLMDYAFYLLNSDAVVESVEAYQLALDHKLFIFETRNIQIALAHEDLAYSLYVNEYNSGNFQLARCHAETSILMMKEVLPPDHILLASAKRVKALILEEMALGYNVSSENEQKQLLATAEKLHLSALKLSQETFGEANVQTAKHYGNLGRLYQSMKQFDKAEQMHQKAIKIKEDILGLHDYEVGLSVGHLASLYNYHMKKYSAAEELYLRSIEINIRLFGPAYSGLEYDYRGLIHVYSKLSSVDKYIFYNTKYREWRRLRRKVARVDYNEELLGPQCVVQRFFEIGDQQVEMEKERILLAKKFKSSAVEYGG
ncbi:amyloid protein-binding protein 2 [Euwallacea similis]|uniref:amyloid protein-binding protein 2 n=1 Tax=Euwallacea similis TaxID=1736056 RepID=UPI00344C08F5